MKYTHILFDVDNTLFDFDETERLALIELFEELGVAYTEENRAIYHEINNSWWHRFEKGEATIPQVAFGRIKGFIDAMKVDYDAEIASESMIGYLGSHGIMYDGALELARRLAPHCRLYTATNGISRVQHARVDNSPISKYFDGMFISQEMGVNKPSLEYFEYVLSALCDVPKEKILMVGDSLASDILGGMNAGLDTCWYNPKGKSSGQVRPTYTVSTLAEIGDIILS